MRIVRSLALGALCAALAAVCFIVGLVAAFYALLWITE